MIELIFCSVVGTLLGLGILGCTYLYIDDKRYTKRLKDKQKLIENLTTFKIKFEDVL